MQSNPVQPMDNSVVHIRSHTNLQVSLLSWLVADYVCGSVCMIPCKLNQLL